MNRSNIYLGTIKKCIDAYSFERFGDSRYVGSINNPSNSNEREIYAKPYKHNALLLKNRHDKYIDIDDINGLKDLLLFKIGKSHKILKTKPTKDDELFVDNSTVKPYFKESNNKGKIKYKVLQSH